jgi:predicted Zn finger-like uncharacterized protein
MYTQCPHCHAIFAVTDEQLSARGGLVRCGQCAEVFQADQYLFDTLPEAVAPTTLGLVIPDRRAKPRPETAVVTEAKRPRPSRAPGVLWFLASLVLLAALLGQVAYFYRNELAQEPHLYPYVRQLCTHIDCRLRPLQDIAQIELVEAEVAPHPDYDQALRVTASLINHARFTQPFPLMEISLTDTNGATLARRVFTPQQYLDESKQVARGMPPNAAVSASLEITLPDARAVGYEIQLFAP